MWSPGRLKSTRAFPGVLFVGVCTCSRENAVSGGPPASGRWGGIAVALLGHTPVINLRWISGMETFPTIKVQGED